MIAKVQVMDWTGNARAGICVRSDISDGEGYNLIFVGGTLAFLNDDVVWGNEYDYNPELGTWYWFKLALDSTGTLYGKVWPDGTAEPANWPYSQSGWSDRGSVFPAVNGDSTVNFSDFAVYAIPQCAAPTFTPAAGTYSSAQSVTIGTTTIGASINYTTDGSTPSESAGTLYSSPVNISTTSTLQAIVFEDGYTDSSVTSGVYTLNLTCAAPTFNPVAGAYLTAQSVTISTTTGGASIRYTTNGTTPSSTAGTVYSSPVNISATSTLEAIAYKNGHDQQQRDHRGVHD